MSRTGRDGAVPSAIAAVFFALGGPLFAVLMALNNPSLHQPIQAAYWALVSSAVISAVFAGVSYSIRRTWYSILLTTVCSLYAAALVATAVAAGLGLKYNG